VYEFSQPALFAFVSLLLKVQLYVILCSMTTYKISKINQLTAQWMMGTPSVTSFLIASGFSRDLIAYYKKSRWLEPFGRGAYVRRGDNVDWLGALNTLQTQLKLPFHLGGKTALELQGHAHYLRVRPGPVYLYGPRGVTIPSWFDEERLGVEIIVTRTNIFPTEIKSEFTELREKEFVIRMSAPERAMMEMLHLVPYKAGYSEAHLIMENLVSLRPDLVQVLLEQCRSIKVKRLFLFLAETCEHTWFDKLDLTIIDLGRGKRMIVPKGWYDKKYRITVPRDVPKVLYPLPDV
jgi:hypothetical protein